MVLKFLTAIFFGSLSCCAAADLAFDWAAIGANPGPFHVEGTIPFIVKQVSFPPSEPDPRTGLYTHFVVSCWPTLHNESNGSVLVRLDINPKQAADPYPANGDTSGYYSPKCWYNVRAYHIDAPDNSPPNK